MKMVWVTCLRRVFCCCACLRLPQTASIIFFGCLISYALTNKVSAESSYKLPGSLVPLNYYVRIRPIFHQSQLDSNEVGEMDTALGFVRIKLFCVMPTSSIILHRKYLEINESSVAVRRLVDQRDNDILDNPAVDRENENIEVTGIEYDETRDFVVFTIAKQLETGSAYEIEMEYVAPLPQNSSLDGFYSIHYQMINMAVTIPERSMAITQFEPLGARQAFPCMDEPIYKATFDIEIGRTGNFTSLSNGPQIESEPDPTHPGWFWDKFQTTVKLPTYLIAFAVLSEFDYSEAPSQLYRLPVRVYGPKEWIATGHAQPVANYTAMLLTHFELKFGQQYNMPKLDLLWVSGKTAALECHGLILFGNQMLVVDEDGVTDLGRIVFNRNSLSHEIAHVFFGNMVGSSWTEVWLKEGITTYLSYVGSAALWPELDQMQYMIYEAISTALEKDNSHPLRQEAYTKAEIDRNMDTIGYDKGASLVKMMVGFLGEQVFYNGLRQYLAEFKDQVATQDDLFEKMNEAAVEGDLELHEHLKVLMTPWTEQVGYPLVRVIWEAEHGRMILTQERWESLEAGGAGNQSEVFWDIPVKYVVISGDGHVHQDIVWMKRDGNAVELEINTTIANMEWILLVNSDGAGYYRVLYDDIELTPRIVKQLLKNHSVFTEEARARLLDDQLNLALQRYIPIQTALEFTKYLGNERNPTVWYFVLYHLLKIFYLFRPLVKGLQTAEDFIKLKDKVVHMFPQNENANSSGYITDNMQLLPGNDSFSVEAAVSIIEQEVFRVKQLNNLDDHDYEALRGYLLPRINSTLEDIVQSSPEGFHFPGTKNFSLSSVGILESFLIDWSCSLQTEWCLTYVLRQLTTWAFGPKDNIGNVTDSISNPIPTDIQAIMYCHIVHWLGYFGFDWIHTKAQTTNDTTQETWLTVALGCAQENNSFSNILNMLTNGHVGYNNTSSIVPASMPQQGTISRLYAKPIYTKIMQHSELGTIFIGLLFATLPISKHLSHFHFSPSRESVLEIVELFQYSLDCLWTEFHQEMVQSIVTSDPDLYGDALNLAIDSIQKNRQWMNEFRENVTVWLRANADG